MCKLTIINEYRFPNYFNDFAFLIQTRLEFLYLYYDVLFIVMLTRKNS
jgi:hypothetical protein